MVISSTARHNSHHITLLHDQNDKKLLSDLPYLGSGQPANLLYNKKILRLCDGTKNYNNMTYVF